MSLPQGAQATEGATTTTGTEDTTGDDALDKRLDQMVDDSAGEPDVAATQTTEGAASPTEGATPAQPGQQPTQQTGAPQQAGQQQPAAAGQDPAGAAQQGRLHSDKEGNLVDGRGQVVAKAGKERRLWEDNSKLRQIEIPRLSRELADVNAKLQNTVALNGTPQQLGITNEQAMQGMRMIASYVKNPLGTLKLILTEAKAAGHNLQELGVAGGALDTAALGQMIDQRIKPLLDDRATANQQSAAEQQADEQYRAFTVKFPDASMHEDNIALLLGQDMSLTPEAAYYKLKTWALENKFDWSQPLKPQIEARQQGAQTAGTQSGQQAPMNVRGTSQPAQSVNGAPVVADADASYGDIVKESMREAGIPVS